MDGLLRRNFILLILVLFICIGVFSAQSPASEEDASDKGFQLAILFVRVRGTPSATGNYGHGGSYPRKLAVDEVLEVREYLDGDCGRRPGA